MKYDKQRNGFLTLAAVLSGSIIVLFGCVSVEGRWEKSKKQNSIISYKSFLADYPNNKYTNEAQSRIEDLEWRTATSENSLSSLQEFASQYPFTKYSPELKRQLEQLAWEEALQEDDLETYTAYKDSYPDSTHFPELEDKIDALTWEKINEEGVSVDFRKYLATYPDTKHKTEVLAKLEDFREEDFIEACKEGKLAEVNELIKGITEQDVKSKGLMMAVYGALHTSTHFKFVNGQMVLFGQRSSSVPREAFVKIIDFLQNAGADPYKFRYKDFGSVKVREHLLNKQLEEQLARGEKSATAFSQFGGAKKKVELLTDSALGMSIFDVAKIEEAEDIVKMLSE